MADRRLESRHTYFRKHWRGCSEVELEIKYHKQRFTEVSGEAIVPCVEKYDNRMLNTMLHGRGEKFWR